MSANSFKTLALPAEQLNNLDSLGYQTMTPVQQASLPLALQQRDLIALAETGSGKTVAFGIPLVNRLDPKRFRPQALVLCPTRELCTQVSTELRKLARYQDNIKILSLTGGRPIGPQIGSLKHGAHILIATPGRLNDHIRKQTVDLSELKILVLDEADRMLDMGFLESIEQIIQQLPRQRQTLCFSATLATEIKQFSESILQQPELIDCRSEQDQVSIEQRFYRISKDNRQEALLDLIAANPDLTTIVFANTRKACMEISQILNQSARVSSALHGEIDQQQRDQTLIQFANQSIKILVATDVAARGIDISHVERVINYEVPRQAETYIHRIGRTGRAGKQGLALSLLTDSEAYKVADIEAVTGQTITVTNWQPMTRNHELSLSPLVTLSFNAGKKEKIRPGDLLGALIQGAGLSSEQIGKIDIHDHSSYVAIERKQARKTIERLHTGKVKGRKIRVRKL